MPTTLQSITITNLLSFGENSQPLEFKPLNILIGTNGSGKSNLLEVLGLLHSASGDLADPIRAGGGIVEWLWKGTPSKYIPTASIEALVKAEQWQVPIRYRLAFTRTDYSIVIEEERIESAKPLGDYQNPFLVFEHIHGRAVVNVKGETRQLRREEIDTQQSILSQRKDPDQYPEITYLGSLFSKFSFYRDWEFGINSDARGVYAPDSQTSFLDEDASNLGLMLNRLRSEPPVRRRMLEYLRAFYEDAEEIQTPIAGGLLELRLEEKNGFTTPARRLSDGTLRWLALLTVLLNPSPPPLVCIEEPELGLHPDVIHILAKLLKEAAQKMQLIVTTHSSALVEEFTDEPETIVICEKNHGATALKRLSSDELSVWLQKYNLGELWRKGELGGNRW
jgi:predicted ATPase